ncbi:MAG: PBP1A family penicillin-binding protein [Pseudomonadota bacterium]
MGLFSSKPAAPEKPKAPPEPAPPPKRKPFIGWKLKLLIVLPLYAACFLGIGLAIAIVHYTIVFPNPLALRAKERAPVVRILDARGDLLVERGTAHDFMPLDLLPRHVIDAVVATEDRRFHSHFGVDPVGLTRAAFANLRAGRYVQGGSTITQQLAKNLFLSSRRTLARKLEELVIAFWLEVRLNKSDILELYLNRVYFGGGAYGIEAAAQRYFGKSARALRVSEAAMIAGLLKAPSRYSPTNSKRRARSRARSVLRKMRAAGVLQAAAYDRALADQLNFARLRTGRKITGYEYAVDYILERLPSVVGTDKGTLIVETTIDRGLQARAQRIVSRTLAREGHGRRASQAAMVVMAPSGALRVLVGGRDHRVSQFNRATKAKRQPGSAFKPFVYLAGLERGLTANSTSYDMPLTIGRWSPRNFARGYRGAVTLREGLRASINTVAVRLQQDVGAPAVIEVARRLGIRSKLRRGPSLALGTSEVSLMNLTAAYASFANGGYRTQPYVIRRIKMSTGRVLYARRATPRNRIIAAMHVGAMNDMLNAAMVAGTGRRAALPRHPAAGKTGTSQGFRDAWFVGYTGRYVASVWIGNDKGRPMRDVTGGGLPARIWRALMIDAHKGRTPRALPGTDVDVAPRRRAPVRRPVRSRPRPKPQLIAEPWHRTAPPRQGSAVAGTRPSAKPRRSERAAQRASRPPVMPKERIDDAFFTRALGQPQRPAKPPLHRARNAPQRPAPLLPWQRRGAPIETATVPETRATRLPVPATPRQPWYDPEAIRRQLGLPMRRHRTDPSRGRRPNEPRSRPPGIMAIGAPR